MERAILGGGRSFQFNGRTLRGSAYRLHRRTCYTKKEPPRRISEVLKVAATRSVLPLIGRSGLRLEGHASLLIHKVFYVLAAVRAARTRAAHLLLRMSPGHSRCASIASPAQRVQTCTASWKSKGDDTNKEPLIVMMKGSESGGYLLSHNAVQYHRRC